jgi:hypothetical protein
MGNQKFVLYAILIGEPKGKITKLRLEYNLSEYLGGRNVNGVKLA